MLLLLILIAFLSPLFLILPNFRKHERYNLPPGPKGLPIIGNLHQLDPFNPHLYLSKLAKIYSPIFSLRFGQRPAVVIQSAALAKEVLKTQDHNFCTRPTLVGQQRLSYNRIDVVFAPCRGGSCGSSARCGGQYGKCFANWPYIFHAEYKMLRE